MTGLNEAVSVKFHPETFFPSTIKVLGGTIIVFILIALTLYGISVYFESRLLKIGRDTRTIQEDNQSLQITLDRLKSFEKVADASSKTQGLQIASETINVMPPEKYIFKPVKPPKRPLPREIYGY